MSRSRKKHPCSDTDNIYHKMGKKEANRRVRRLMKNPDFQVCFKAYRKCYESWDIRDYFCKFPDYKEALRREKSRIAHWSKICPNHPIDFDEKRFYKEYILECVRK